MTQNGTESTIRVIIADDHPLIIKGITELLEKNHRFVITKTFTNGNALLQSTAVPDADVLLLDLNMPGKDGLQVLEEIKSMKLKAKILVLTSYFSKELAEQCQAAGANGYILKSDNLDRLADNILEVMEGKGVFPDFSMKTEEDPNEFTYMDEFLKKYNLTKRETEVIQMVCKGYNSKEIADQLYLSSFTVQTHRRNIFRKLNIEGNTIALYKFASAHGLL
ncbi:response regulator transcription factor [Aequorivita marisscotiae]|uniref:Response regulator transcription factor n=1 Tax=Aequorivita marisscotiae TaxID=3040348 RepID=A0ABY8KR47_9FLAO|nr:response regulator transcription factor [Aequorivita sp. Ant34-E75]WGF91936.1 response regulator transcription factor [Aequorivita sp. Ant34-E75]